MTQHYFRAGPRLSCLARPRRPGAPTLVLGLVAAFTGACTLFASPHERGERYLRRGNYQAAVQAYDEAIRTGDFPAVAYANRCYAEEALGDRKAAVRDCSKALELIGEPDPEDAAAMGQMAEVLNNRGVAYIGLREYENATGDFTRAVELQADYAAAYANRGRAYVEMENYDAALRDLEKAVELNPGLVEAYGNMAHAYTGLDNADQALESYARAIEVSGGSAEIYFDRASLYYAIGRFGEALADYRQVADSADNDYLAWIAQQQVNFLKNWDAPGAAEGAPPGETEAPTP
ncbi:MAG: tetratricopeptide repeat protein [Anaerolineae bacterium]